MDLHLKKVMTYFVEFVQDKEKSETPPPGLCSPSSNKWLFLVYSERGGLW